MLKKTLIGYFHEFRKRGDKAAVIHKTGFRTFRWSYAQFSDAILKTATLLEQYGLKKGDRALLYSFNAPQWGVAFFACILKGIIVVPIDVKAKKDLIENVQKQVKARLIFQTKFREKPRIKAKQIFLEDLEFLVVDIKKKPTLPEISERNIVEIVYTSGTTGKPKGVMLTQENLIANIRSLQEIFPMDNHFTFLSLLPLSHLFEQNPGFFIPLIHDATIIYPNSLKPSTLFEILEEEKVTAMIIVPRLLQAFQDGILREARERGRERIFARLLKIAARLPLQYRKLLFLPIHRKFGFQFQFFVIGGAPLDSALEQFWNNLGFTILQGYGLTETSPVLTCNTPAMQKIGSVGKAIPGVELKIEKGEVLAKGRNVFQGYYQDVQRTKQAFAGEWFGTGDLGYFDAEGFLYLKGRSKDMIVTPEGMNVYAEDVETVLNKIPGVKDSSVIGMEKGKGEEVFAVLLLEKKKANPAEIIRKANQQLHPHQQITGFAVWPGEDFPRTTTLKVQKFKVKELLRQKKAEAVTPAKDILTQIIAETCRVSPARVKPKVKLVELGLSSIDRLELISLIEQEFNLDIDEELITEKTTVKELEQIVKDRKAVQRKQKFRQWPLWFPVSIVRFLVQEILLWNITRLFCWTKSTGKEQLRGLQSPVIFIANHQSFFDAPCIVSNLPFQFKTKLAIATLAEFFEKKGKALFQQCLKILQYYVVVTFFNSFLLPQRTTGFKASMAYAGKLMDRGYSLLYFPEGERTLTGKMGSFKTGIGILVSELKVPVVPITLEGLYQIFPRTARFPKFGRVKVKFGNPMHFTTESPVEITKRLEKAVKGLQG